MKFSEKEMHCKDHKKFKWTQALAYQALNRTCMPLHTPKTLETGKKKYVSFD